MIVWSAVLLRCLAEFDYLQQTAGSNVSALVGFSLFLCELTLNMKVCVSCVWMSPLVVDPLCIIIIYYH